MTEGATRWAAAIEWHDASLEEATLPDEAWPEPTADAARLSATETMAGRAFPLGRLRTGDDVRGGALRYPDTVATDGDHPETDAGCRIATSPGPVFVRAGRSIPTGQPRDAVSATPNAEQRSARRVWGIPDIY